MGTRLQKAKVPHLKKDGTLSKPKMSKVLEVATVETYHTIVIAPTGTGKSQIYMIPSIIHNVSTQDKVDKSGKTIEFNAPTVIVTDVKGELFAETASYAASQGYKVHCFNTRETNESLSYNPLYHILQL